MSKKEWYARLGKVAFEAAREMVATIPDEADYIAGTVALSGKEVKEKFETDLNFAEQQVERIIKLAADISKKKAIKP